jgi:Protein kinase domain
MLEAVAVPAPRDLVLGRYRPLRPLGAGGSGSVWLCRDEASGLEVALKIVASEGKAAARAEREVAAAARLRHERCLRAYALERDEGHVYIAYEYVPGRTVREAIRAGELDDRDAVEAAAQVLDVLGHAHGRGIVHRDVKPSNVLLADEEGVSVRLLDFGLAQIPEAETLTAIGDVPGTLAYIAPERLRGAPASAASDVWSVGVMLWESLAGQHPFWSSSLLETARAIEAGPPPLGQLRPDLPKPLRVAVDRALSLDPARRPGAERLSTAFRSAFRERERRPRPAATPAPAPVPIRPAAAVRLPQWGRPAAGAALAALAAGWSAAVLPFFPAHFALLLAALAASMAFLRPRLGLAFALAVPILPLGNVSLGLAFVYAAVAVAWLAIHWREPEAGLLLGVGPLLAPVGALPLLALATFGVRSPIRRAAHAGAGVLLAALVAGLEASALPFTGERPPLGLGIAGSRAPLAVASALVHELQARPVLILEAAVLAGAAIALPYARARGLWWLAGLGAAVLAAGLLPLGGVAATGIVACVWVTCVTLAVTREKRLEPRVSGTYQG